MVAGNGPNFVAAISIRVFAVSLLLAFAVASTRAQCAGETTWLPTTPASDFSKPLPHPATDCGFYKPAWQNFLVATQASAGNSAAFLQYPTIPDVFGSPVATRFAPSRRGLLSLAPRALQGSNDPTTDAPGKPRTINAGVRQAGLNGLLIDQNGQSIFYAIHMNDAFASFIRQQNLTTKAALQGARADLEFPKGAVELKSAWQIVPDGNVPSNYITTRALVPVLKQSGNTIDVDPSTPPREVTVALLAIHVVFVLDGHPEFIWATFEHISAGGARDLAPAAGGQPSGDDGFPNGMDGPISPNGLPLYKANTAASQANQIVGDGALVAAFDSASQSFTKGGNVLQTSIYRRFPGSKQTDIAEDGDVTQLNQYMASLFPQLAPNDPRKNYQLVGAIWLDKPESTFKEGLSFKNPQGMSTDDQNAIVAGEDGLSSMAMESFTQDSFVNCFSCHDTRAVKDLSGNVLMPAKRINVSHILSKFVSEGN